MSRFTWVPGRSGGGYRKMTIIDAVWPIRWDMHLLHIPQGARIFGHTDPVHYKRHYRLNIILRKPRLGGKFICEKMIINLPRLKLFRPDLYRHSVATVDQGERLVLSIGWAV